MVKIVNASGRELEVTDKQARALAHYGWRPAEDTPRMPAEEKNPSNQSGGTLGHTTQTENATGGPVPLGSAHLAGEHGPDLPDWQSEPVSPR